MRELVAPCIDPVHTIDNARAGVSDEEKDKGYETNDKESDEHEESEEFESEEWDALQEAYEAHLREAEELLAYDTRDMSPVVTWWNMRD